MVATSVFLNRLEAFRARLCVCSDPSDVLRLGTVLDVPNANSSAICRTMRLFPARPTPNKITHTTNLAVVYAWVLTSVRAPRWVAAPFHDRVLVDISSNVPLFIFVLSLAVAELSKKVWRDSTGAFVGWATRLHTPPTRIHLTVQVACPTVAAETVGAT
jgi:hypothetical protein